MHKFVGIRVYDMTEEEIDGVKPFECIEFVYDSSWYENVIVRNMAVDSGACNSKANDGKLVLRPQSFLDFRYYLEYLDVPSRADGINICRMELITPETILSKKEEGQKYYESSQDVTIRDVINLAKKIYYFGYMPRDLFQEECLSIIEEKLEKSKEETEPGQE